MQAGYVAGAWENSNTHKKVFFDKPDAERPLRRLTHKLKDNIKTVPT